MRPSIAELIERLEREEEGDDELDLAVAVALELVPEEADCPYHHYDEDPRTLNWETPRWRRWKQEEKDYFAQHSELRDLEFPADLHSWYGVTQTWTQSVDCALELLKIVLPGWARSVDATLPEEAIDVDLHEPHPGYRVRRGTHKSEAIATVIAILRSREQAI